MFLSQLAVVFVGIVGNHHETVEHQLAPTLEKAGVAELAIPDPELGAIVKHTKQSKAIVKKMHVGGVIAAQLAGSGNTRTFRVVIYDAEGNLSSETESPISPKGLAKDDLDVFAINIADIAGASPAAKPKAQPKRVAKVDDAPLSASHTDDDAPPGLGGAPAKHEPATKPVAAVDDDAAAAAPTTVEQTAPAAHGKTGVHVELGLMFGMVGRSLATDPGTVKSYTSTPVATFGFEGALGIGKKARLAGMFEHTVVMHSDVDGMQAATAIGRYELAASYDLVHDDSIQLAPMVGFGARYFTIDGTSTTKTPDDQYTYVVLGASIRKSLGTKWALRGLAAFEPVVGGVEPKMANTASRWGFDVGAALEVQATQHVFARASFDYQSFNSSWSMVGGTTDAYPGGSVAAGATF
jgi:opacity protein-like surface antigen